MSDRRYFGLLRVHSRPAYTQVAMRTLAVTRGLDRIDLHVLFSPTDEFTLAQMQRMAEESRLPVVSWIKTLPESSHSFRLALLFMRAAVGTGEYERCLWLENDVAYNSDWFERLEELYDKVTSTPGAPPILWAQAINYNLPSIHKVLRDTYVLAHRSGKVAMMIDAAMVRKIAVQDKRWGQDKSSDTIIEEMFRASGLEQHWFLWPVVSAVDHIGRRGVSTQDDKAFALSRGIGFVPEPHVVEALEWLKAHEYEPSPTWLGSQ